MWIKWVLTVAGGRAYLWRSDTKHWRKITEEKTVLHAVFSPDGKYFTTTGQDGITRLWRSEEAALLAVLPTHYNSGVRSAVSPDNRRLATTYEDGLVRLWNIESCSTTAHCSPG